MSDEIVHYMEACTQMRAEIERLRAENEDMKRTLDAPIPWLLERDLRAEIAQLTAALRGMLDEWEKLARYGSPMAKAANERVNAARRALKGMKPDQGIGALDAATEPEEK